MSKAFLCAYVNNNFGDDLFIDIITKRYPETKFYTYGTRCGLETLKGRNIRPVFESVGYRAVNKISRVFLKKRILNIMLAKRCDVSIHLGGSLFIEDRTWRGRFDFLRELAEYSQRFCIIGANFGPYNTKEYENTNREFFGSLSDVCFRDTYSCGLFSGLGDHIHQAPDVAFCIDVKNVPTSEKIVTMVCISVEERDDLQMDSETYMLRYKELVESFVKRGYRINLVSFCDPQGDLDSCKKIFDELSESAKQKTVIKRYLGNLEEIIDIMGRSEIVFAGRFHGMILGWILGKNTIPVIYSDKMKNVIEDIEYKGLSYDLRNGEEFSAEEIINNKSITPFRLKQYMEEADKQFQYLDEVLGKSRKG